MKMKMKKEMEKQKGAEKSLNNLVYLGKQD